MLGSALDQHEGRQEHGAGDERHDRGCGSPGVGLGIGESVDQREQAQRRGENPRYVDRITLRGTVIDQQPQRHDRRRDGDHKVDVEAPAPGQDLGERTAEYQPERGATPGDRAEDPERRGPFRRPLERHRQQPERRGCEQCGECPLERSGGHEHAERTGPDRRSRGDREPDQAGDQAHLRPNRSPSLPPSSRRLPNASA
jgi:hypothetical protein